MKLKPGQAVRLLQSFGNEPGRLHEGMAGVVRELVPADVPGAHNDYEDSAVVEFQQEGGADRAVAFGRSTWDELLEIIA